MTIAIALLLLQSANGPSPMPQKDFVCGAVNGYVQKYPMAGHRAFTQIEGKVTATGLAKMKTDWLPVVGITFYPPKVSTGGVSFLIWQQLDGKLVFGWHKSGSDSPTVLGKLDAISDVRFRLRLDNKGALNATINGQDYKTSGVKVTPSYPTLTCSGGTFRFEDVVVSGEDDEVAG